MVGDLLKAADRPCWRQIFCNVPSEGGENLADQKHCVVRQI